jgi:protein-S-isoprenylcysteine O-methyltransferase Ste14
MTETTVANTRQDTLSPHQKKHSISTHQMIAHSYLLYMGAIVIGFAADFLWPTEFSFPAMAPLGMLMIVAGTALAFWAQHASKKSEAARNSQIGAVCRDHFCVGPYVFTKSPTQYGLFFMAIGLAMLFGSVFTMITTVLAFLIGQLVIAPKKERHLEAKYGAPYAEYRRHVKL